MKISMEMDWKRIVNQVNDIGDYFYSLKINYKQYRKKSKIKSISQVHVDRRIYMFIGALILIPLASFIFVLMEPGTVNEKIGLFIIISMTTLAVVVLLITLIFFLYYVVLDIAISLICLIRALFITTYLMLKDTINF
jgi:hypothetical protein